MRYLSLQMEELRTAQALTNMNAQLTESDLKADLHATKADLHATKADLHATKADLHATRARLGVLEKNFAALNVGNFWVSFWDCSGLLEDVNATCSTSFTAVVEIFIALTHGDGSLARVVEDWLRANNFNCGAEELVCFDKLVRTARRNEVAHALNLGDPATHIALEPDAALKSLLQTMYERQQ